MRLHRFALSGHAHRVELFLSILGVPVELVEVDLRARAQKTPEFLAKNPFGQVPVLEDGETVLADSAAILTYLALRFDAEGRWFPPDPVRHARVVRWFSVAAGPLLQGPALARAHAIFGRPIDLEQAKAVAAGLFTVLDAELATKPFLVGEDPTLADLTLYAYTAHAPEGGISLAPYARVRAWLERIRALPGFIPMQATRTALYCE